MFGQAARLSQKHVPYYYLLKAWSLTVGIYTCRKISAAIIFWQQWKQNRGGIRHQAVCPLCQLQVKVSAKWGMVCALNTVKSWLWRQESHREKIKPYWTQIKMEHQTVRSVSFSLLSNIQHHKRETGNTKWIIRRRRLNWSWTGQLVCFLDCMHLFSDFLNYFYHFYFNSRCSLVGRGNFQISL